MTKLCHIKCNHPPACVSANREHFEHMMRTGWSRLIWHNFVKVADNCIKICSLAYIGTYNMRIKFGLKIPNRLGKENLRGDFWLTRYLFRYCWSYDHWSLDHRLDFSADNAVQPASKRTTEISDLIASRGQVPMSTRIVKSACIKWSNGPSVLLHQSRQPSRSSRSYCPESPLE